VAIEWKVPVVRPSWVFDSFRDHKLLDLNVYSLRILEGLVLCTTGLSESSREQVAKISCLLGATYHPNMEIGHTDLLLAVVG
jgi:dihydrodipicolinate reductase